MLNKVTQHVNIKAAGSEFNPLLEFENLPAFDRIESVHARPALERFYRRAARDEIAPRLDRATELAGTSYSALDIRAQRTRWASCSAGGRMSFNWRLLLAPERVLEYVVWHEVCHLQILDHSPRFWALVERRWPSYREDRQWLSRHGATLVL